MKRERVAVAAILFVFLMLVQFDFWPRDACLDAGGVWTGTRCDGVRIAFSFSLALILFICTTSLGVAALLVCASVLVLRALKRSAG